MPELYKKLHHEHSHVIEILDMNNIIHNPFGYKDLVEMLFIEEKLEKELGKGEYLCVEYVNTRLRANINKVKYKIMNSQIKELADKLGLNCKKRVFDWEISGAGFIIIFKHEADMVAFNLTNCFGALV